jgi:hypothetical protein
MLLDGAQTEYSIYYSHFDGTWSPFTLGWEDPASLVSGWSRARNDVYLVRSFASDERDIVHFDGKSPVTEYSGAWRTVFSFERVLALGGAPSGDVWAVGSVGATIRKRR